MKSDYPSYLLDQYVAERKGATRAESPRRALEACDYSDQDPERRAAPNVLPSPFTGRICDL